MSLITISLGSNIEPQLNLEKAIHEIAKFAALKKTSKIYKSKSMGFEGNDFLNQVILEPYTTVFHRTFSSNYHHH